MLESVSRVQEFADIRRFWTNEAMGRNELQPLIAHARAGNYTELGDANRWLRLWQVLPSVHEATD